LSCRDDPQWENWHEQAYGVQGGLEDSGSSSDSEEEEVQHVTLPTTCVCSHCRLVLWHVVGSAKIWKSDTNPATQSIVDLDTNVADPGCLSRIQIFTHPGSRISDS
jgi:hypothetical protein